MDWSCEYEFDELEIPGQGFFYGIAELAIGSGDEWYVKNIVVFSNSWDNKCLTVPKDHWLFKEISQALYKSDHADEYFWSEYHG